jgi:hypothetical protein
MRHIEGFRGRARRANLAIVCGYEIIRQFLLSVRQRVTLVIYLSLDKVKHLDKNQYYPKIDD